MDENSGEYVGSIRSRDYDSYSYTVSPELSILKLPAMEKDWECHLFGGDGMIYIPREGQVPNILVRFMMKVLLGCKWVKKNKQTEDN